MARLAAIVLAAGRSSRMGELKPLLPLGDGTVIGRAVGAYLEGGVSDVRVVVGWRGAEVAAATADLGVDTVTNGGWQRGMFSSVAVGVASLGRRRRDVLSVAGGLRPGARRDDRPPRSSRAGAAGARDLSTSRRPARTPAADRSPSAAGRPESRAAGRLARPAGRPRRRGPRGRG
jgi:hypothetical protein